MATIHVPSNAIQQTVESSQPGDELIFDAGRYVFDAMLRIHDDRRYHIVSQEIEVSDLFQGDYLFEIEDQAEYYCICHCHINLREKCGFLRVLGSDIKGLIEGSFVDCGNFTGINL